MEIKCNKCEEMGLCFRAEHIEPIDYIEGKRNADIWIIGLNPKGDIGHVERRTKEEFENFSPDSHSYFKDFEKVLPKLYQNFSGPQSRVAHTDIVKCFSNSFPPVLEKDGVQSEADKEVLIHNCKVYLEQQIRTHKPKLIICNGSPVCWTLINMFHPPYNENWSEITSYEAKPDESDHRFRIVLSGYIGRIDDRNKRRLGKEIEQILSELNIDLDAPAS